MTQSEHIASRLREVFIDGKWIANTNYKEQLENTNWKQATQQVGSLNTIAVLTYHINYYLDGILHVFQGGDLEIRDKYSFDLPPIESETDWLSLVTTLLDNAQQFVNHIESFDEQQWEQSFVDPKYGSYLRNMEGVIEHSYYHLGQIVLIKRMLQSK